MPSSTSSSNDRLPVGDWGRTWLITLLLVLVPLAGWEAWWRLQGFGGQVKAPDEHFVLLLHGIPRESVVVVGASRIQAALDPAAFQSTFGGKRPINLSLPGESPLPVLEYLADSTSYAGVVIAEMLSVYAFDATQKGGRRPAGLIQRHSRDRVSPARMSENWLQVYAMQPLVFREPRLLPSLFIPLMLDGRPIRQSTFHYADGFAPVDHRSQLPARAWDPQTGFHDIIRPADARSDGTPPDEAEFAALLARYERAVERIQARGGRVVMLRLPGCGSLLDLEEKFFPRARYWDRLVQQTKAVTITGDDYPELSRYDCWDGSHVDERDAPAFGAALGRVTRAKLGR